MTTGQAKLLGKKKWGLDMRFTQAVFWIKMKKYIVGDIFSSGRVTLYKNSSDPTVKYY